MSDSEKNAYNLSQGIIGTHWGGGGGIQGKIWNTGAVKEPCYSLREIALILLLVVAKKPELSTLAQDSRFLKCLCIPHVGIIV